MKVQIMGAAHSRPNNPFQRLAACGASGVYERYRELRLLLPTDFFKIPFKNIKSILIDGFTTKSSITNFGSLVKRWQTKKFRVQGAQISCDEACFKYVAITTR